MSKRTPDYLFKVPNTEEGHTFLRLLRKFSISGLRFRARGRGKNRAEVVRKAGYALNWAGDLPVSLAEWYAVYATLPNNSGDGRSPHIEIGPASTNYRRSMALEASDTKQKLIRARQLADNLSVILSQ